MKYALYEALSYEQPTKYTVNTENYNDTFTTPVLTAGKTFVLGYTDETDGICYASTSPVIIFDDFTSSSRYVDFDFKVKSSAMKILHKSNEADNLKYFYYAMQKIDYKPFTHKRVWISEYSKIQILQRSPMEQNAIVGALDNIQSAIYIKEQQLSSLDELIQARFLEVFGDPEANSKGWPVFPLRELCTVGSSKRIYQEEQSKSGIPFLRISDINELIDTGSAPNALFIPEERYSELLQNGYVPSEGDILVTSRGTLGRCYIIQKNDRFYFQDGMITWLSKYVDTITPTYLSYLFRTDEFRKQIDAMQSGSTVAYLSIAMIKRLLVMVPPIEFQHQFASFTAQIDKAKSIVQHQLTDLQELFDSKLEEYFG